LPKGIFITLSLRTKVLTGVAGFVGTNPNERPRPISNDEAKNLLQQSGEIEGEKPVRVKQSYEIGDHVKITEGSFATFEGVVEEVNLEKNTLRVNVQIFGRSTPVEVDVVQVEKL
jgi:transcriptional antiterminator NusG